MKEFLTVAELAKELDISTQAIYKRLNKDLANYVVRKNNRVYIKSEALPRIVNHQEAAADKNQTEAGRDKAILLETLIKQLEAKDEQIERLSNNLTSALNRLQESQHIIYQLRLGAPEESKDRGKPEDIEILEEDVDENDKNTRQERIEEQPPGPEPREKKSIITLIKRLLK